MKLIADADPIEVNASIFRSVTWKAAGSVDGQRDFVRKGSPAVGAS